MKLVFLGTRGYIGSTSRRHRRHSALLVTYRRRAVMIDCGEDWLGRLRAIAPRAVLVTHAHPDHAWGLRNGAPCPVYATRDAWLGMQAFPIPDRQMIEPRTPILVEGIVVEAFPVVHSLRAPAVGYRLQAGRARIFYVPDVVDIPDRAAALGGIDLYIGDGATVTRPMVRRRGEALFGHTTIGAQLGWCARAGVGRAAFTHCGSEIVKGDERRIAAVVRALGRAQGVEASIAHDALELTLP
jgi:phosphoribosyl 1,2-cyclic phosphodiesterase